MDLLNINFSNVNQSYFIPGAMILLLSLVFFCLCLSSFGYYFFGNNNPLGNILNTNNSTPSLPEPTSGNKMYVNIKTMCANHSEDGKMYGHACGNYESQEWRYDPSTKQIKNYRDRKITCVDGSGGKGDPVTLKPCDNSKLSQKFDDHVFDNVGFKNRANNLCLDILGGWAYDKQIGLYDCNQTVGQRFFIE